MTTPKLLAVRPWNFNREWKGEDKPIQHTAHCCQLYRETGKKKSIQLFYSHPTYISNYTLITQMVNFFFPLSSTPALVNRSFNQAELDRGPFTFSPEERNRFSSWSLMMFYETLDMEKFKNPNTVCCQHRIEFNMPNTVCCEHRIEFKVPNTVCCHIV